MRIASFLYILLFAIILSSCSSSGDDDNPTNPISDDNPIVSPSAVNLVFPENNTECNTGVIENETQSNVTFEWNASENTETYELNIVNLNTSNFIRTRVSSTEATVLILRGTPYEWFVISESTESTSTATSQTWRFYNEGPGVENYAPFPAEGILPDRGANLEASTTDITLEWTASDIDDDIVNYEVFFGIEESASILLEETTNTIIENIPVESGNTYYWKIITYDSSGNSSTSETFEFRVL